ncbi:MAG: hypothetical protein M1823_006697, partial [Watsoniomyces obsoletus]
RHGAQRGAGLVAEEHVARGRPAACRNAQRQARQPAVGLGARRDGLGRLTQAPEEDVDHRLAIVVRGAAGQHEGSGRDRIEREFADDEANLASIDIVLLDRFERGVVEVCAMRAGHRHVFDDRHRGVGLADGHRWKGGASEAKNGITCNPNIPTEEVFTTPHRLRVDGYVAATKPLSHNGALIEDMQARVEGGRLVELKASKGQDIFNKDEIMKDDMSACVIGIQGSEVVFSPLGGPTGLEEKDTDWKARRPKNEFWLGMKATVDILSGRPAMTDCCEDCGKLLYGERIEPT